MEINTENCFSVKIFRKICKFTVFNYVHGSPDKKFEEEVDVDEGEGGGVGFFSETEVKSTVFVTNVLDSTGVYTEALKICKKKFFVKKNVRTKSQTKNRIFPNYQRNFPIILGHEGVVELYYEHHVKRFHFKVVRWNSIGVGNLYPGIYRLRN